MVNQSMVLANNPETAEVMTLAEDMAEKLVPMNDNSIPVDVRGAMWINETFLALARLGRTTAMALREKAAEMYLTKAYLLLKVPMDNDPSQFMTFPTFRDWLGYACERAKISDTTASTIVSFMDFMVDPVSKQLVHRTDGSTVELDDVLKMREGHTQKAASAARQTLLTDPENYDQVGKIIEIAEDPDIPLDDFNDYLKSSGVSRPRIPAVECNTVELADGKTIYLLVAESEAQSASLQVGLNRRVEYRTRTLEDMAMFVTALNNHERHIPPHVDTITDDSGKVVGLIESEKPATFKDFGNYLRGMSEEA